MRGLRYIFLCVILLTAATTYVYSQSWDMFFDKGKEHYDKGNYEKAIENLELYLKYETTNPKAEAKQLLESAHKIVKQRPKEAYFIEDALGLNMKMIYVEGGTFMMGAPENDEEAISDAKPQHQVTLDSYYIAEFEVTQSQWEKVMGTNVFQQRDKLKEICNIEDDYGIYWTINNTGNNYPMYYMIWDDASAFCEKLSKITGKTYMLPTEAQWEFAARGGNRSRGYKYSGSNNINEIAWYGSSDYYGKSHPSLVGTKQANELGIYDMNGNVWEWCNDGYGKYNNTSQINPTGTSDGFSDKVIRGGSFNSGEYVDISYRTRYYEYDTIGHYGFRVVCIPE